MFLLVELSTHCAPIGRQSDIPGDNRLPEVSLLMTAGIILLERQTIGRPAGASADQNWVLMEFVILRKYGQN